MKKLAIIAACVLASAYTYGQGTLTFDTSSAYPGGYAFIDSNGNGVKDGAEVNAYGPAYIGQLVGSATETGSYTPIGTPVLFGTVADGLDGYITTGGDLSVSGAAAGSTYWVKLHAWKVGDTSTEGFSPALSLKLGGPGDPPTVPASLDLLGATAIVAVPEPSTIALGLLGLAALLIRRRN